MNDKKIALYARVSTENQDLSSQVGKLKNFAQKENEEYDLFAEKASSVKERPKFEKLMKNLENYKYVVITKLDRFGRSLRQMLSNIEEVNERSGGIVVIDDQFNIDTRGEETLEQEIIRKFLSLFAEVERKMIRRRMEEGYKKAREENRVGRPEALSENDKEKLAAMYESGRFTWEGMKTEFGVSKATISKALKEKGVLN
ncbi:MAG: recombinase family protein [Candidatus Aenigmatarchaeota archaeon]